MAEYINRNKLLEKLCKNDSYCMEDYYYNAIKEFPNDDVLPVVHAKWIEYPRAHYFKCSNCKYTVPYKKAVLIGGKREYNYCPHCGAKMDFEEGMRIFDFKREVEWNPAPLNGQKISTYFKIKNRSLS